MLIQRQRRSRRRRQRRLFLACLGAAIAVMLYLILGPSLRHRFLTWRYERSLAKSVDADDARAALSPGTSLTASIRSNPGNPPAWRLAAAMLEYTGDRAALSLRRQIIELEPTVADNRLALARTALRFRDVPVALAALDSLPDEARDTPEFKRLVAGAAFVAGRNAEADELLVQSFPPAADAARSKIERQLFRLHYGNFSQASDARQELETASRQPELRGELLRELIHDDLRRNDPARALARAESLVSIPEATFADRLLRADVVVLQTPEKISTLRVELAPAASGDADRATLFVGWLANHGQLAAAVSWVDALPAELRGAPGVRAARTGLALAQQNSAQAVQLLADGAWGAVNPQAVQLALSARLLEARERPELRHEVWSNALVAAEKDLSGLQILRRLALLWQWPAESAESLKHIARKFPGETWAHRLLAENYFRQKETGELKAVYALWHEASPADARVEMMWLFLELLTAPVTTENSLTARVQELYTAQPKAPLFATAYALSLWQLGRNDDALTTFDKLPPNERRTPQRAFYYALYLATARRLEEARTYLELSTDADLLSEEKTLLNRARSLAEARSRS